MAFRAVSPKGCSPELPLSREWHCGEDLVSKELGNCCVLYPPPGEDRHEHRCWAQSPAVKDPVKINLSKVSNTPWAQKSFSHVSLFLGAHFASLCERTAALCPVAGGPSVLVRRGVLAEADRWPDLV